MGQITVKEDINPDIFGRHVNRAARVEQLADGGQVFATYNVLDSAKGWLVAKRNEHLAWKSHGRYWLKGITEPIVIFEVYRAGDVWPRAPRGVKKKMSPLLLLAPLVLVLLGVVCILTVLNLKSAFIEYK